MFWRFPINSGDRVGLLSDEAFSVIVTEFTPFFIVMRNDDGNTVVVPNAIAFQQIFVIYHAKTPEQIGKRDQSKGEQER